MSDRVQGKSTPRVELFSTVGGWLRNEWNRWQIYRFMSGGAEGRCSPGLKHAGEVGAKPTAVWIRCLGIAARGHAKALSAQLDIGIDAGGGDVCQPLSGIGLWPDCRLSGVPVNRRVRGIRGWDLGNLHGWSAGRDHLAIGAILLKGRHVEAWFCPVILSCTARQQNR